MKRFYCMSLAVLLAVLVLVTPTAQALTVESQDGQVEIIHLDDGSYIMVTIREMQLRAAGSKLGTKEYEYIDSNGSAAWKAVLRGVFSYTGTTATCTSSVCDVTIYDTVWYVVSREVRTSGNSAIAELTMGTKYLGITVSKKDYSIKLSCDVNGNLS